MMKTAERRKKMTRSKGKIVLFVIHVSLTLSLPLETADKPDGKDGNCRFTCTRHTHTQTHKHTHTQIACFVFKTPFFMIISPPLPPSSLLAVWYLLLLEEEE